MHEISCSDKMIQNYNAFMLRISLNTTVVSELLTYKEK
jgi:hypothetical protein